MKIPALTRTQWACLAAALLILIASWWLWRRQRRLSTQAGQSASASDVLGDVLPIGNEAFPLKRGSRGERVRQLQAWLNEQLPKAAATRDLAALAEDGVFGPLTAAAVTAVLGYQKPTISQEVFDKRGMIAY